ncbi:AraC family transcriptional regulator [Verrucomicrobia bacterium LW23]|nr:AraC family transcriptional regulator [Verrucomicrobia bacterium LW23]
MPMHAAAPIRNRHLRFRDWAALRASLLWAYEGETQQQARNSTATSMDTSVWLVRTGRVSVTTDGVTTEVLPGQWVFVASPTRHQVFHGRTEILSVHFRLTWPGGEQVIDRPRNLVLNSAEFPGLEKAGTAVVRRLARLFPVEHGFLPGIPCSLDAYLQVQNMLPMWLRAYLSAMAHLGHHPRRIGLADDRVLQGLAAIEGHPMSLPFSEKAILAQAGLARSQFDALFIREFGVTPRRYYDNLRHAEARELLRHTSLSIKEIAIALAFRHASHFTMWFRARHQLTPAEWRHSVQ